MYGYKITLLREIDVNLVEAWLTEPTKESLQQVPQYPDEWYRLQDELRRMFQRPPVSYSNYRQLQDRLDALASTYSNLCNSVGTAFGD